MLPPRPVRRCLVGTGSNLDQTAASPAGFEDSASAPLDQTTAPADPPSAAPSSAEPPRGALIGRYVVLERLGAGAMGVVVAAFDPDLDRKVAIKLLHPQLGGAEADARGRLLREAQALASLSHPNVVAIFDVGTRGGEVWLAMELVTGVTLRAWLGERRRPLAEVLAVMQAVGAGLAAAHAAGLVHRDVKPDNVMIGADGRVKVMDFGLARAREAREGPRAAAAIDVTLAGSLVGTPAYMAPEQLRRVQAGAPADVFAFCVMVWEAVHGARPFAGDTFDALAANVVQGRIAAPPRSEAPRWLDAVLRRGLAVDPALRFPHMDALLAALARGRARATWRRRALLGAGLALGVSAVVLGAWGVQVAAREQQLAACAALGDEVDLRWNEATRERLRRVFVASELPFAADLEARTSRWLDGWSTEWRRVRVDTCVRHAVDATWSADLRARADDCLHESLLDFAAQLDALAVAGRQVALLAPEAAAAMSSARACGEVRVLELRPALPDGERGVLGDLRGAFARVRALHRLGQTKEGLTAARAALDVARALAWPPAVAEARLLLGSLEKANGEFTAAALTTEDAYFEAAGAGAREVEADAAILLVALAGVDLGRRDDALRWGRLARLALAAVGGEGRTLRDANLRNNLALTRETAGDEPGARAELEAAVELFAEALGPDHPDTTSADYNLAILLSIAGEAERARVRFEAALEGRARALGPESPRLARLYNAYGTHLARHRDFQGALAAYQRALDLAQRAYGPEHPDVADALGNLAGVQFTLGNLREVEATYARVAAIHEKNHGPRHVEVAETLSNLGFVRDSLGRHAEAKDVLTRAASIFSDSAGDHHRHALCLSNLGLAEIHLGELDAAERHHEEALAIRRRLRPAGHPEIAASLRYLAHVAALRGDVDRARALLAEAAPAQREDQLAEARFALARAQWQRERHARPAARALAEQARAGLTGPGKDALRAEVDAWLAAHPLPSAARGPGR